MKIKFLGAAGTVTGSSYILTSGSGQSILIDLGMFQGPLEIEGLNYETYDFDTSKLVGAVLTHAHLDHSGRLPLIMKGGFKGNIYMTPPTADLTELSLLDSAKIAKEDKSKVLYNTNDVINTVKQFVTMDYRKEIHVGSFIVTFRDAGHILGAASLEIIDKDADSEIKKVVFSGDLGNSPALLEQETDYITSSDAVVMERTNAMHIKLPEKVDLITIDTAWTKQILTIPNALENLKPDGIIISLIKPHYESPKEYLEKGRLKDEFIDKVLDKVKNDITAVGGVITNIVESPILGEKGKNREYLAWITK